MGNRSLLGRGLFALSVGLALLSPLSACGPRVGGSAPLVMGVSPWPGAGASVAANRWEPPYRPATAPLAALPRERTQAAMPEEIAALPPPAEAVKKAPRPFESAEAIAAPPPARRPARKPGPPAPVMAASRERPPRKEPPREKPPRPAPETRWNNPPRVRPAKAPPSPAPPPEPAKSAPPSPAPPPELAKSAPPSAPAAKPAAGANFLWPVKGRVIAGFGAGPDGTHNEGINIAAPRGAPVAATAGGVVVYAGNELRGYGNLILIKHPEGWISAYAHLDVILVKRGERVSRGQVIGRVGDTGSVNAPQLHFELRRADRAVDPLKFLAPRSTAATSSRLNRG